MNVFAVAVLIFIFMNSASLELFYHLMKINSEFQDSISIIHNLINHYNNNNYIVIFGGDFNSDINRGNRFDKYLLSFLNNISCFKIDHGLTESDFTYKRGDYLPTIDHISFINNKYITKAYRRIIYSDLCDSDHNPIILTICLA